MGTTSLITIDQIVKGPGALPLGPSFECLLCKGTHFVCNCPSLLAAQQKTEHSKQAPETELQKQVTAPLARPSVPNEPSASFKRDGTAVMSEFPLRNNQLTQADSPSSSEPTLLSEFSVKVIDPALPTMSPEFTS